MVVMMELIFLIMACSSEYLMKKVKKLSKLISTIGMMIVQKLSTGLRNKQIEMCM